MSVVPVFKIGLWNAWIFAIPILLLAYLPIFTLKDFNKKMGGGEHYGKIQVFITAVVLILMIYSIFLPLRIDTLWFYSGLIVYLLGFVIGIVIVFNVASTPLGEPFTKGIYRYSRNPGYIVQIIVFVGIGLASASWLYMLLSVILTILTYLLVIIEEQKTIEKLGDPYREYMNRTPRWIGIPK